MILDEDGNLHHSKMAYYHTSPVLIHYGCIDFTTYDDCYLSAGIEGVDEYSLRPTKTSIRAWSRTELKVHEEMPWPKYGESS